MMFVFGFNCFLLCKTGREIHHGRVTDSQPDFNAVAEPIWGVLWVGGGHV
jgi:hypothetical protein